MATILNKNVIRESKETIDERNIMVTLSENQEIKLKLKGMKSGELSISIKELYNKLSNNEEVNDKKTLTVVKRNKKDDKKTPLINLYDLRSSVCTTPMDIKTLALFDGIVNELIKKQK